MDVNLWGLSGLESTSSGEATMSIVAGGTLYTKSMWALNKVPSSYTMAYHEIIYGSKPWNTPVRENPQFLSTPIRIRDAPRILIATNYSIIRAQPAINMAFEAWLFTDPNNVRAPRAGDLELMAELHSDISEDYAKKGALKSVPLVVNGQLVYRDFDIIVYEVSQTFIKFKPRQNIDKGYVIFDYTYFINATKQFLKSIGWSRGGTTPDMIDDLYIMSLELGTEVFTGTTTPAKIDVEWYMYNYSIVLAPKTVPAEQALQQVAKILATNTLTTITVKATTTVLLIVKETVECATLTIISTVTSATTRIQTLMQTITTTAMQIDWRATAVIATILLIIGIVIGWIARRKW